jgi:hypothetical protein
VPVIAQGTSGAPVSSAMVARAAPWVAESLRVAHAGALREEREQATLAQDRARGLERIGVRLAAPHRERAESDEQPAVARLDQLALRHEAHVPARAGGDEEGVVEALVVGRNDRRPLGGDVLGARDVHAEVDAHERDDQGTDEGVERR